MSLHPEFLKFRYAPKLDSDSTETIISEDFALTCIGWEGREYSTYYTHLYTYICVYVCAHCKNILRQLCSF